MFRNVYAFANGIFVREESLGHTSGQHAVGIATKILGISNEVTAFHNQASHFTILGRATDQAAIDDSIAVLKATTNFANRNRASNRRDRRLQHIELGARQSVRREALCVHLFTRWLDRANHDRIGAQALDLLLSFLANAFANCKQPNHAGHTDEDTEHG